MIDEIDAIVFKVQAASNDSNGVVPARDSWLIYYTDADRTPDLVFKDPGTLAIANEKIRYSKRQEDGVEAYLSLMSEFRLNGQPRVVNQFLEGQLETVRNEVTSGQWITALEKLDVIVPSGDLTQVIYDKIELSLTTYIADNY